MYGKMDQEASGDELEQMIAMMKSGEGRSPAVDPEESGGRKPAMGTEEDEQPDGKALLLKKALMKLSLQKKV